jgi:CheY-like chemotaxis protein
LRKNEEVVQQTAIPELVGTRVLLVEDNLINQELAQNMLENLGCDVSVSNNGVEALAALSKFDYQLVLMDCQMPQMDGFEATAVIRRNERESGSGRRVYIIALTANAMEGDKERCLAAGMDDYLAKPITQSQLRAVMERWLKPENRNTSNAGSINSPSTDFSSLQLTTSSNKTSARPQLRVVNSQDTGSNIVLDQSKLDGIRALQRDGAPSLIVKFIDIFLEDSPVLLETIRTAVAANDANNLFHAAHTLKSSSANLGAVTLSNLSRDLELIGRNGGSIDGSKPRVIKLEKEYERVRQALLQERNKAEAAQQA